MNRPKAAGPKKPLETARFNIELKCSEIIKQYPSMFSMEYIFHYEPQFILPKLKNSLEDQVRQQRIQHSKTR